jgi:hypothetical protein
MPEVFPLVNVVLIAQITEGSVDRERIEIRRGDEVCAEINHARSEAFLIITGRSP